MVRYEVGAATLRGHVGEQLLEHLKEKNREKNRDVADFVNLQ